MPIDISPILSLFKGKSADNFKVLFEGYVKLYEQYDKRIDKLEAQLDAQEKQNSELRVQLEMITRMEERCLDQNVRNNEVIRNLAEWIIFTERREEISKNIGKLLK